MSVFALGTSRTGEPLLFLLIFLGWDGGLRMQGGANPNCRLALVGSKMCHPQDVTAGKTCPWLSALLSVRQGKARN